MPYFSWEANLTNPENFILSLRVSVSRKYQTEGDQVAYFLYKEVVLKLSAKKIITYQNLFLQNHMLITIFF